MESYHEDPAELLPELSQSEESRSESLLHQFEEMQRAESKPARLVLVFASHDDRAEFFRSVMRIRPQDLGDNQRPPCTLVKNWRTEGGDDVPL